MASRFKNIYQFKIELEGVSPPVWRRIQVPENYSFWDLHVAIVDAMGWLDYHLHEFKMEDPETGMPVAIGITSGEEMDLYVVLPDHEQNISDYFTRDNRRAEYHYDFGDDWFHSIELEDVALKKSGKRYPACIAGERACPPEDCGGVSGYDEFLRIIADPSHEERDEMLTWAGGSFDPERFDHRKVRFDDPGLRWRIAYLDDEEAYAELLAGRVYTYSNRKGDRYFLKGGATKGGGVRYNFSRSPEGHVVEKFPAGYEVYESPSGRVYCRRVRPETIMPEEKSIVESAVRAAGFCDFIVDANKDALTVYTPDLDAERYADMMEAFGLPRIKVSAEVAAKFFKPVQQYSPMLRFLLEDKQDRRFSVERYCFMTGIDDWLLIEGHTDLKKLANKYCKHLGEDSFYDLY